MISHTGTQKQQAEANKGNFLVRNSEINLEIYLEIVLSARDLGPIGWLEVSFQCRIQGRSRIYELLSHVVKSLAVRNG